MSFIFNVSWPNIIFESDSVTETMIKCACSQNGKNISPKMNFDKKILERTLLVIDFIANVTKTNVLQ